LLQCTSLPPLYSLSLHDALPIFSPPSCSSSAWVGMVLSPIISLIRGITSRRRFKGGFRQWPLLNHQKLPSSLQVLGSASRWALRLAPWSLRRIWMEPQLLDLLIVRRCAKSTVPCCKKTKRFRPNRILQTP